MSEPRYAIGIDLGEDARGVERRAVALGQLNRQVGTDLLVSRLGPTGKRVCLVLGQSLMLWATWLLFSGSLAQARINLEVEAPVSGLSMAIFYASGVVFAVLAGVLLLREIWRTVSGQLRDDELVMVQESEDLAQLEELHLDRSGTYKHK